MGMCMSRRTETRLWRVLTGTAMVIVIVAGIGCATPRTATTAGDRFAQHRQAMEQLKSALSFRPNPVVRAQAVEALESLADDEIRPWIRSALLDEHPGVRFAACMAIGRLQDTAAESAVRARLSDSDASVRVAALFAMHRLGATELSGRLSGYLLHSPDAAVRRNAAIAIAMLGEPSGIKVLASAMKDADAGVRQHALEAMARLGSREAKRELTFMANSGVGAEEVFALNALAATCDPAHEDTFRYKLATAAHLETRLAAARGLGKLGIADGLAAALEGLATRRPPRRDPDDPGAEQLLRIHQLAASAAGAIGRIEAIAALQALFDRDDDPRVRVSISQAVIEIVRAERSRELPFASTVLRERR